jgi:HlyD family secretion protein
LVEPKSELVAIGAHLPGIVTRVFVRAGESVRKGAPLFQVDDRPYQALKAVREGELQLALAQQEEANALWQMALNIKDPRAMSADERVRRHNRAQVATAQVTTARASLKVVQTDLERLVVEAPADGEILKVNVREGEAVGAGVTADAPIMMGDLSELHVRVDIDENDAARFNPENNARGFIRGASATSIPLRLVRVEPLVIPKRSLTGASGERIDTRVLQAIYALEDPRGRVSVGQQMDIFIEADQETPQAAAHEADSPGPAVQ